MIAVDERGLTSADWTVYNNGTKRTRNSSAPTSGIIATRPLALRKDGTWFAYGWDLTKNICEVFGPAGYIRTAYTYSPYGEVTASGDVTQPIQWSSEYNDAELSLIYYNYRHYSPVDGRWMGRDKLSRETMDITLYGFSNNMPPIFYDWLGLLGESATPDLSKEEKQYNLRYSSVGWNGGDCITRALNFFNGTTNIDSANDLRNSINEACKEGCIESISIIAHGEKSDDNKNQVWIHFQNGDYKRESRTSTGISNLFKGLNFCDKCKIELRACWLGSSPYLKSRLEENTGCEITLYSRKVSATIPSLPIP